MTIPKKIHIIGSVGSGKTTLAKEMSSKFYIPYYELDNVVWKRLNSGDIRRTEQEREEYLNSIIQLESWIIEGVHNEDWVSNCFHNADLIIFLDTRYSIRTYRIIKRFLKQKLRLEKSNYEPTLQIFFKMFKWNRYFENIGKVNFFNNYGIHTDKIEVIRDTKCIKKYFN
ncbi:Adenylate kinase [Halobacillus karajensis]|uniref:Topology modulation protein n=1 Tax=Halobacillus karajensis TaxID=195088 RepID=A0A024P9B5_9BACI|nr:DNA topology modulation protein FlaR [Halobacillus karajensis]CDQ20046.1 topology modulation protein [Halobacillus karajensis]CDQ25291.1 topology modulation protein [Halobacillus karajensis]CDQ28348.1 topology modulation protein [Halobacillus karajensis]SEH67558.1 Adenylate kinase [Halobacillus karajensis]